MQFPADLVTFTEEIPNGKLHFLRGVDSDKTELFHMEGNETYISRF